MTGPYIYEIRALGVETETDRGVAEELSGSDIALNVYNATLDPDFTNAARSGQTSLSPVKSIPGPLAGSLKFDTDLQGNGSGAVLPALGKLLTSCGFVAGTGGVYGLTSSPAAMKSLTAALWEGGFSRTGLRGGMGTFAMTCEAGKPVVFHCDYKGAYIAPVADTIPSPSLPVSNPFIFENAALDYDEDSSLVVSKVVIDAQNALALRMDGNSAGGIKAAQITARPIKLTLTIEAQALTDFDPVNRWLALNESALSFVLTNGVDQVTVAAPSIQINSAKPANLDGMDAWEIDAQLNGLNDNELTLTWDSN